MRQRGPYHNRRLMMPPLETDIACLNSPRASQLSRIFGNLKSMLPLVKVIAEHKRSSLPEGNILGIGHLSSIPTSLVVVPGTSL